MHTGEIQNMLIKVATYWGRWSGEQGIQAQDGSKTFQCILFHVILILEPCEWNNYYKKMKNFKLHIIDSNLLHEAQWSPYPGLAQVILKIQAGRATVCILE